MKKSELYHMAMDAVLDSSYTNDIKLDILKVLFADESIALYNEKSEEE